MKLKPSKSLLVAPLALFASFAMTSCKNEESVKSETTTTETTTTQEAQIKSHDTLPPLDSTAVTKPEEKLNGPSK